MRELGRRLTRLEQKSGMRSIATNERDPGLVELFQRIYRDKFRIEMVPLGVEATEFLKKVWPQGPSRFQIKER